MAAINLLPKELSELIAAGEVIERPSSVVKELLENSIDSGANMVTVEIKQGGSTYIRITDNGCGIPADEVRTAFLRHATSKIQTRDDLNTIMTLGFRGEALASVAAVSRVEVLTKVRDAEYGAHYIIEGTEEKTLEKCGCPDGTTIIIRDIFYNVPARRKFLKKDVTEGNAVAGMMDKIALSHPELSVKLIRNNRQELFTPGDGDLRAAIYAVFGRSFAQNLLPVEYTMNHIRVSGFVAKPLEGRANRSFQNFFINGRYIKSVTCTVSLEEAYQNSMMVGKFPACVLNLEIPPQIVDVNVHPAKIEVRFSDEKLIFDSVYFAVKNALLAFDTPTELTVRPSVLAPASLEEAVTDRSFAAPDPSNQMSMMPSEDTIGGNALPAAEKENRGREGTIDFLDSAVLDRMTGPAARLQEEPAQFRYIGEKAFAEAPVYSNQKEAEQPAPIRVIGEAFRTYILAEAGSDLLLIDKHAAHERCLFEELKASSQALDSQMLLDPEEVALTHEEFDALELEGALLERLGFSVEAAAPPSIWVQGVPACLNGTPPQDILPEIAQNILQHKQNPQTDLLDDLYHSMACKAAVKANDKNDLTELKALAERVCGNPSIRYCPHGRPTVITMSRRELEKQFKRIP